MENRTANYGTFTEAWNDMKLSRLHDRKYELEKLKKTFTDALYYQLNRTDKGMCYMNRAELISNLYQRISALETRLEAIDAQILDCAEPVEMED